MEGRFPRTGVNTSAPGSGKSPQDGSPAWPDDRACCCPAQPLVRVIMRPTSRRRRSVDVLLCGHHYRISRQALAAAHARIEYLPGKADAAEAALLETLHQEHAEVR